jgi:hypothetical protein
MFSASVLKRPLHGGRVLFDLRDHGGLGWSVNLLTVIFYLMQGLVTRTFY